MTTQPDAATRPPDAVGIASVVGFLVCVEVASGAIQGFYTPLFTDIARRLNIADAEVNWFEAAQLALSAVAVPVLAKLGDLRGHRTVLLASTAATAAASWAVAFAPTFATFLVAWALVGAYVVWLPLEVSIVHLRTRGDQRRTRLAASVLVAALEASVIASALGAGALSGVLGMTTLLCVPAAVVTLALVAIWFGVPATAPTASGRLDWPGVCWVTLALLLAMAGLMVVRLLGPGSPWPWLLLASGVAAGAVFVRVERRASEPLVDLRVLGAPGQWPIQVLALLFGASVLGAQIPLSTFARTDPAVTGYGLGLSTGGTSIIIGAYVLSLLLGALSVPLWTRRLAPRTTLVVGAALVSVGYLLFLPNHASMAGVLGNMLIAGFGSGMLVALLPAAAAAAAPASHTGVVTGMTNAIKTVGGAFASSAYALALASHGLEGPQANHAPLAGYLTVWTICGVTAAIAAVVAAASRTRADA